jgi:hypothetical protein
MNMLRNTLFGLSLLALTTGSAFAATSQHKAAKPAAKTHVVAQADTATPPAADKPAKKATKKSTKKSTKTDAPKGEMKAPAPETK